MIFVVKPIYRAREKKRSMIEGKKKQEKTYLVVVVSYGETSKTAD